MAVLAILAVLASACSTTAPARFEPRRLRVLMADDWAGTDAVDQVVRRFEEANPDVRIELDGLPFGEIPAAVEAANRIGRPYDLAQWHAFAAGALELGQPVDDLWDEHGLTEDEFLAGAVEDVTWAGRRYGVPLDVNAMILLANGDALAGAGVEASSLDTFEGVAAAAAALTDGTVRGFGQGLSTWSTYGWIRANGGEVVEIGADGRPRFLLDDPRTIEAVEFLAQMAARGWAPRPPAADQDLDVRELFNSGAISLFGTGSWDLVAATARARIDGIDAPAAVALPVPAGPAIEDGERPGTALGGSSLFLPVASTQRTLAFELALALVEDDVAISLARDEGRLPVRTHVYDDEAFDDPTLQVVREQLATATPMRLIAFDGAQVAFARAVERVLVDGVPAAEALRRAQAEAVASLVSS